MIVNTTGGPREPTPTPGRHVNTSRIVEEDLEYLDEEPEIAHVLPGGDWCALVDGRLVSLVAWVVLADATMYGVAGDRPEKGGTFALDEGVGEREGFRGYVKQTKKEKKNDD